MAAEQLGEVRRSNGGWKGSPNSIAALLRSQVPFALSRKCDRCGQLAVSGKTLCRMHAGSHYKQSAGAGRGESRRLAALERCGLLPLELLSLPTWRNLVGLPTGTRAPMRLALVQAWDKRDQAPLQWAKVQRQAIDLGNTPGRRQNTAWYYENC